MNKLIKYFLFVVGLGIIWESILNIEVNKILYEINYKQLKAHACEDLKSIGVIYCFDENNPNYMTIPLFENPNEKKTFIRLKDEGEGLEVIVFEQKMNKYQEVLSRVRIKDKGYDGWINKKLIRFD